MKQLGIPIPKQALNIMCLEYQKNIGKPPQQNKQIILK